MSESLPGIAWLVVLLAGNAFFVGAEFAVISARRSQIEPLAAQGKRSAKTTLWAMEHATLMLAASQLGITICSLLILTVSEPAIHHLLTVPLGATGLSPTGVGIAAFAVALALVTFLHVVLGEMVPKNLSFSVPDRAALLLAPPLVFFSRLARPVIAALNATANGVVRLCRVEPVDEATSTYTLEEVEQIVERSRREGTLTDRAGTLAGAFEFTDKPVGEVAVPVGEILVLAPDVTPRQLQEAVREHDRSRFVVGDVDGDPVAYIHLKDLMDLPAGEYDVPVPAKRLRRLPAVPDTAEVESALALLRRQGTPVGRTVDADGRVTGVIFLEDVVDVLFTAAG